MRRFAITLLLLAALAAVSGCGGSEARKQHALERGQALLTSRDYVKARIEFRNAVQIDPNDAAARTLLGEAAEGLGNYEEAVGNYRKALDLDPKQERARARLGRMMVFGGVPDQALELIEPGLASNPTSADLLSVRGTVRMQQGDLDTARKDAEAALAAKPNHSDATALLASVLWREQQRDEALALLDRTIVASPDDAMLRQIYAQLLLTSGKPQLAEEQLREVVRLEPENQDHRYRLAQLYVAQKKPQLAITVLRDAVKATPDDVEAKLALANLIAAQGSFANAEQELRRYVDASPKDFDLRLGLGRFYETNGRPKEAEGVYRAVLEDAGDKPAAMVARTRLASLMIRSGRAAQAAKLLDEVLAKSPSNADALVMRAQLALLRNDTETAIADMRTALRDQPTNVLLAAQLAQAYIRAGNLELAEQTLRQVVQANPTDARARLALAQFLLNKGEGDKARPVLEQLVADDPNNSEALEGLARLRLLVNDPAAALQAATTLQTLQPGSATGFFLAGVAQQAQANVDEARKSYEQALAVDPRSLEALMALARLDLAAGAPAQALARYTAAVKAQPAAPLPYRGQAVAYVAMGDTDRAIEALKVGLEPTRYDAELTVDLANLYERRGRHDDAIALYGTALERNPGDMAVANNLAMLLVTHRSDAGSLERAGKLVEGFAGSENPALLDTYGWVLFKRGRAAEAIVPLEKAVAKAPDAQELRYHLGMAQLKAGKKDEGRKNLEAAVQGGQGYPGREDALKALGR